MIANAECITHCTRTARVAHLAPAFAAAKLPTVSEAPVKVDSNEALVQRHAVDVLHAVLRVGASVVHHKAEAARRVPDLIEAHNYALDVARLREHLLAARTGWIPFCVHQNKSMQHDCGVHHVALGQLCVGVPARMMNAAQSGGQSPVQGGVPLGL